MQNTEKFLLLLFSPLESSVGALSSSSCRNGGREGKRSGLNSCIILNTFSCPCHHPIVLQVHQQFIMRSLGCFIRFVFFPEVKRAYRPQFDSFTQSIQNCMTKIELAIKPELEKMSENKIIDLRKVRSDEIQNFIHDSFSVQHFKMVSIGEIGYSSSV